MRKTQDKPTPKVIYQDKFMMMVHKPAGISVYSEGTKGEKSCYDYFKRKDSVLLPVHRIDKATCGLVIFAKDPKISSLLQKLFKTEKIKKTYWAFVEGEYNQSHVLNMPLKDPKSGQLQKAKTILDVYQKTETITWLICEPKTGRTHQIRKHLKLAGFPILGDELYGGAEFEQMALCAVQIEFTHPVYRKTVQVRTFPDLILKNALKKQGIRF